MSKMVLRKAGELALADFLASGRVVTKCPTARRMGGGRIGLGRSKAMPLAAIVAMIRSR